MPERLHAEAKNAENRKKLYGPDVSSACLVLSDPWLSQADSLGKLSLCDTPLLPESAQQRTELLRVL